MDASGLDESGADVVALHHPSGATAEVHRHGAHVTSWRPDPRSAGVLFLSRASRFERGQAIRGGVPVIFPQFADRGPYARHGFARVAEWSLLTPRDVAPHSAAFALEDTPKTRRAWPHAFRAVLRVELDERALVVALSVENRGREVFEFTAALHTYLAVDDVREASVAGLEGVAYESRTEGVTRAVERAAEVRVRGEVDRVYFDAPRPLTVRGAAGGRSVTVSASGFPDVVLWNPGAEKARALPDLADDEWRRMLCVEGAVVGRPVRLEPAGRWEGKQRLDV